MPNTLHEAALPRRVLIADDECLVATHIVGFLGQMGIAVIGPASHGAQAVELARVERPDLAILDIRMPQMDGLDAAAILYDQLGIPVVLLSAYTDPEYIQQGAKAGVFGYLIKPVNGDELRAALAIAWSRFRTQADLRGELDGLKVALEERKLIERAKGLMMDRLRIGESEAMRRLQRQARDTRRKLPDVAREIIESQAPARPARPSHHRPPEPRR